MNLLDRYLLTQFIKHFLLVLSSVLAIYLLVDFFERIDNFSEAGPSVGLMLKYLLLKVPAIYDQLAPVCVLLAGVITVGLLTHSHEMMALKAAGICVSRIVRPMFIGALFFTLLTLVLAQWVLPAATASTNRIWYQKVKKQVPKGIDRYGRTYYRGRHGIYTFRRGNPRENRFHDFIYSQWAAGHRLEFLVSGREATWSEGIWTVRDGQLKLQQEGEGGGFVISDFATRTFEMPEKPADFFLPPYQADEMSLFQMYQRARSDSYLDRAKAWSDFQGRLSYIFLGLPLLLIGIPILLFAHERWRHDLSLSVPISCGIAFASWGWWSTAQSLARAGQLNPILAAWSIHLLVGGLGYWLLRQRDR